jgi:hypothetical protein
MDLFTTKEMMSMTKLSQEQLKILTRTKQKGRHFDFIPLRPLHDGGPGKTALWSRKEIEMTREMNKLETERRKVFAK